MWEENPWEIFQGKPTQMGLKPISHSVPSGIRTEVEGEERPPAKDIRRVKLSHVSDFTWGVKRKLLFYQMLTKVYTTLILNPNSLTKQNWTPFAIKLKGIKNEVGRRGKTPAQVIRRAKLAMYQILHEGQNENFCFTK